MSNLKKISYLFFLIMTGNRKRVVRAIINKKPGLSVLVDSDEVNEVEASSEALVVVEGVLVAVGDVGLLGVGAV